ncbi:cobalamin-dependent protein [bacterium]|nr:cobalamin-dependent protein [bacterium]
MKLLLTSVFKPFAVDDAYGRKENVLELFHNQVTREQGIFSLRYNHESMGLHLMADNISVPTVVLDFPSQRRFIKEIKKGYDYVGISFIVPNFLKAKRMATLVRRYSPRTKIILGGHGTTIEHIEHLIDCDYICRGEGVRFLRELFKNDVEAPITHPIMYSAVNKKLMGVPLGNDSSVIVPGTGCANACRFCCTSHFFGKKYTAFLKTGREIFDLCQKIEQELGVTDFFIMDENFLKQEERARELLACMESHNKAWSFGIFSSAETINRIGLDFIERLGVLFLWMGVESKQEIYEKNKGVDFQALVRELRNRGISVLASGILFLEHHNRDTIHEDIDFMVGLNADFVQFMQLGPLPGTQLYQDYTDRDLIRTDIPYEEWHGQHQLWFNHPHFSRSESSEYLKNAFIKDYQVNGPSILRMIDTAMRGVIHSADNPDPYMRVRHAKRVDFARHLRPLLNTLAHQSPTIGARQLASQVKRSFDQFFGETTLFDRVKASAVHILFNLEQIRLKLIRSERHRVRTYKTSYRMSLYKLREISFVGRLESNILTLRLAFNGHPATMKISGILDNGNIKNLLASLKTYLREIKADESSITLNFSNLQIFDEEALRRLFEKMQHYHYQFKLECSANFDSTKRALEKLIDDFQRIKLVYVS